ncbi:hypothetical protein NE237_027063 [Protea cynaroides]|uniref:CCHC-type domain-containing protein n=1 Tax=Protea cynaroides TaxID=273540 RepID=A0A9Q0GNL5_9MAGN|nr:hypothetical protein NE237_027063 [Protea cynaroides]
MVTKRQKLARRKYKEANPELFPKPEPTAPKDPHSKKKNKNKFKRTLDKSKKSTFRKHPLRVPGMKPGESCFICKAKDHIAKLCPEKAQWERNKICLVCRQRGHSLKNCPNKNDKTSEKYCYNCGGAGHSLSQCSQPLQDGGTKFASCFICNERGHLSKNCPKNTHGIYPKGGSCKICGGITHLAKDCPDKGRTSSVANRVTKISSDDEEEWPRKQVTSLVRGDELEDDFYDPIVEDTDNSNKNASKSKLTSVSLEVAKNSHVKSKKKQGPKVVNFIG